MAGHGRAIAWRLRSVFRSALLLFLLAVSPPTQAQGHREPTVSYSGILSLALGGAKPARVRVFYGRSRVRAEAIGGPSPVTTIIDGPKQTAYILNFASRTYQTFPLGGKVDLLMPLPNKAARFDKVGVQTMNGVRAVRYRVRDPARRDAKFTGLLWRTKENIIVRVRGRLTQQGKSVDISMDLTGLRIGPLEPRLFRIPAGFAAQQQ